MAIIENDLIAAHTVEWQLATEKGSYGQTVGYVTNDPNPDVLLVTGFAETDTYTAADMLSDYQIRAAICNLTYPEDPGCFELTPGIMEQTVQKSLKAVTFDINTSAGRPYDTPLAMVGRSKGFGELLKFVCTYPEMCSSLSGSAPLAANCVPEILGTDVRQYRDAFRKRLRASGLLSSVISHPEAGRLMNEFKVGMQFLHQESGPDMIRQLAGMGILKHIVIGEDDALCPPDECRRAIGPEVAVEIDVVPGKHDPITSEAGMAQVVQSIGYCLSGSDTSLNKRYDRLTAYA